MAMNKALIAGLACAVGVCAFAAVEGNNTAVVIRKAPVVSDNGYQYLCVPVRGFDITGQELNDSVALGDIIPASAYEVGTELIVEGNVEASAVGDSDLLVNGTYRVKAGTEPALYWGQDASETDYGTALVKNAARLWLKVHMEAATPAASGGLAAMLAAKRAATTTQATDYPETIFAGEQNTVEYLVPEAVSGMTPCGNASSETVEFPVKTLTTAYTSESAATKLVQNPQAGDQLLRLGNNRKTYIYYVYVPQVGDTPARWVTATKFDTLGIEPNRIAPGEAFFYYRAGGSN